MFPDKNIKDPCWYRSRECFNFSSINPHLLPKHVVDALVFSTIFPASLSAPYMKTCSNQLRSLSWFIQPGGSEPSPWQHGWIVALEDWVLTFVEARQVSQTSVSTNTVYQLLSMVFLFMNTLYGRILKNNMNWWHHFIFSTQFLSPQQCRLTVYLFPGFSRGCAQFSVFLPQSSRSCRKTLLFEVFIKNWKLRGSRIQ